MISEMILGDGEAGAEITVPNPIGVINNKYNFDYYCAMAAAGLYALVDMQQYPNGDDIAQKIVSRTKIFGEKIKSAFPDAFE